MFSQFPVVHGKSFCASQFSEKLFCEFKWLEKLFLESQWLEKLAGESCSGRFGCRSFGHTYRKQSGQTGFANSGFKEDGSVNPSVLQNCSQNPSRPGCRSFGFTYSFREDGFVNPSKSQSLAKRFCEVQRSKKNLFARASSLKSRPVNSSGPKNCSVNPVGSRNWFLNPRGPRN